MRKILLFLAIFSTIFASQDEINFESKHTSSKDYLYKFRTRFL